MTDRYLHAIWCDDIRQEVGNKPSFMGAYVGGITVPNLPFFLPKLCAYVWASTLIEKPFQNIDVKVARDDGTVLAQMKIDNCQNMAEQLGDVDEAKTMLMMFGMNILGVELPEDCKYISVTLENESEILEGPKLRVTVASPTQ